KIIYLNKDVDLFTKIDIEFANTLHLQPGETLTIGLELIPENLENPNTNNVMGVLTTKYLLSESKTFLKTIFSKKVNANSRTLKEDLYFELKIVKKKVKKQANHMKFNTFSLFYFNKIKICKKSRTFAPILKII